VLASRLAVESLDVTVFAQTAALATRLEGQAFDLLFLNAGILSGRGVALSTVPDGDVEKIFATNARAPRSCRGTRASFGPYPRHWSLIAFNKAAAAQTADAVASVDLIKSHHLQ
jgi:NAD(P)-dependent dehydrogenase (short-subunit alcohol dehydrogenase family)